MCSKGSPSTTSNATTTQSGSTSGTSATTSSGIITPLPETLALYQDLLSRAGGVSNQPFDLRTLPDVYPWVVGGPQDVATNYQYNLGKQGMGFVPEAAAAIGQGAQSTIGQIPGVAESLMSPWAGQAVDYGQQQGQAVGDWATGAANNIMSAGPQLQPFSEAAVMQYYSPYQQNVIDATQNWFNNQNAIQGNQLIGQGIRQGNMFGGDRAGVAQGILAGQQQLAQAPVIAGLYNQGYAQALQEFNTENQLAAQLQEFGANLGMQGLTAQGQLGLQGLGMGLNASTAANQQAINALAQNQQAALQAGSLFGNLGATQFGSNLAGGQQAINAASIYPNYIQNLMNQSALNEMTLQAYPFQTTSWYGSLLGGIGPLTGAQQANASSSVSSQIANQIANQVGSTTPPQPNQFTQLAGLGLAGLGLLLKDGGSVPGYAGGGKIGTVPYSHGSGYVPDTNIPMGRLQQPSMPNDVAMRLASILNTPSFNLPSSKSGSGSGGGSGNSLSGLTRLFDRGSSSSGSGSTNIGGGSTPIGGDVLDLARGGVARRQLGGPFGEYDMQWPSDMGGLGNTQSGDEEREDDSTIPMPRPRPRELVMDGLSNDVVPLPRERPPEAGPSVLDLSDETEGRPFSVSNPQQLEERRAADDNIYRNEPGTPLPSPRPEEPQPQSAYAQATGSQMAGGQPGWTYRTPPRSQPGFFARAADNPLVQLGLAIAGQTGGGAGNVLTNIAGGLRQGMGQIQATRQRQMQQERLDSQYRINNSGNTQTVETPEGVWDTKLPTPNALRIRAMEERNKTLAAGEPRRQMEAETRKKGQETKQQELEEVKKPSLELRQEKLKNPPEKGKKAPAAPAPAPEPPKVPEVKAPTGLDKAREALKVMTPQEIRDDAMANLARYGRARTEERLRALGLDPRAYLPAAPAAVPLSQ